MAEKKKKVRSQKEGNSETSGSGLTVHIFHDPEVDFLGGHPFGFPLVIHFNLVLGVAVLFGVEHGAVASGLGRHGGGQLKKEEVNKVTQVSSCFNGIQTHLVAGGFAQNALVSLSHDGRGISSGKLLGREPGQDFVSVPSHGGGSDAVPGVIGDHVAATVLKNKEPTSRSLDFFPAHS